MRKIAILNQKGGVGKTTTAVNLSAALAQRGQRVCLADIDPQAHASLHLQAGLKPAPASEKSIYHVLTEGMPLSQVRQEAGENLWVIASDIELAAVEQQLAGTSGREVILRDRLEEHTETYDHFVIDCPPSLGILTLNALCTVDEVFIPLQPHFLALHGLSKLLETIELVSRRVNSRLKVGGVILCMYESGTRLAAEVCGDVEAFLEQARGGNRPWSDAHCFKTRIRRNVRLAEAPSFGQSIFDYAPKSPGAKDYALLADEFLANFAPQGPPVTQEQFLETMAGISQPVV